MIKSLRNILALFFISLFLVSCSGEANLVYQPEEARMIFFGDLMLGRDVARLMEVHGEDYPFEKIFGAGGINMRNYHLRIANLEGPVLKAKKRADLLPFFAFDPAITPRVLSKWGFNLINLSNNHTWDHGVKGWESTLGVLHKAGIATVGNPKNLFQHDIFETSINGIRFGFVAINDVNFPVDWKKLKEKTKELKKRNDFVILMPHWGIEYRSEASLHQQTKAHGMIESGEVDLIIGHHPHVVQNSEVWKGKVIYYSLGNFIFDQYFSTAVQQGIALDVVFRKGGAVIVREIPYKINKAQPVLQRQIDQE